MGNGSLSSFLLVLIIRTVLLLLLLRLLLSFLFFDIDSTSHLASLCTSIKCDKYFPRTIYGGSVRKVEPVVPPPSFPPTRGTHVLFLLYSRTLKQ